jgi:hypothetical protein
MLTQRNQDLHSDYYRDSFQQTLPNPSITHPSISINKDKFLNPIKEESSPRDSTALPSVQVINGKSVELTSFQFEVNSNKDDILNMMSEEQGRVDD